MGNKFKRLIVVGFIAFCGEALADEYYKIDRGVLSTSSYYLHLDAQSRGRICQYESKDADLFLVRMEPVTCSANECRGSLFRYLRPESELRFGSSTIQQVLGKVKPVTKLEFYEAYNRAAFYSASACIQGLFQSKQSPELVKTIAADFPGIARFPDFYERSVRAEFQAEILGVLKKILGNDFNREAIVACVDQNFPVE